MEVLVRYRTPVYATFNWANGIIEANARLQQENMDLKRQLIGHTSLEELVKDKRHAKNTAVVESLREIFRMINTRLQQENKEIR